MKLCLTVILLAQMGGLAFSQEESLLQDAITKPAVSLRCKESMLERADKIKMQQRLNALLQRNENLIKRSGKIKSSAISRLQSTQVKIKNEMYQTTLIIQSMEENIVRSGCPGLSL